jgi:hypothetical protein
MIILLLFVVNTIANIPVMKVFADSQSNTVQFSNDMTLDSDKVIDGNLDVSGGTLNLNGHTLTVEGNLIQPGGNVNVNKGKLIVNGDYRIQSVSGEVYGASSGYLVMQKSEDKVEVGGSFITQSINGHKGYLTAGVMEVKKDFKFLLYYYYSSCC